MPHRTDPYPLLLECDILGRVLWMSNRTRQILGNPARLSDAIVRRGRPPALRFWRVWASRKSVLLGAQIAESEHGQTTDLLLLQMRLTSHFLQLAGSERRLFARAQQRRRTRGRTAIRQIESERRRLGRELHTGVGQMLAAIRLNLEVIARALPSPPDKLGQALSAISTLADNTMDQVRSLSRRLHPPQWQGLTLEAAVRQLWETSGVPQRFEAALQIDPLPREPDLDVKIAIYRAFQEALSNLARHSRATRVGAALEVCDGQLVLSIRDNGVGFDAQRVLSSPAGAASGIGLPSIRETAQELGGTLEVRSGADGTTIVVRLALSAPES